MATETSDYGFNTPVPGTEEDNWGVLLNENFQQIENCFNGFTEVAPNLAVGFWKIDDFVVTATAAELNQLASITATPTEINYISGATSNIQDQLDNMITDLVGDTTPQLGGTLDTNTHAIQFGDWLIELSGTTLLFSNAGTNKMKLDTDGNLTVTGDITAFGTV